MQRKLGSLFVSRTSKARQRVLPFLERAEHREGVFKRTIAAITALLVLIMVGGSSAGRFHAVYWARHAADTGIRWLVGLKPERSRIEAEWKLRRVRGVEQTHRVLTNFYRNTSDEMRELFRVAGMDPDHGLIRWGRGDQAFLISPQVFERDDHGRSYRLRSRTRSVWLRQITLHNGPFGLFQVPDTPTHRAAAGRAGAIVDEHSVQNTNSWGLRGAEPDPNADIRGIVLGDSFMQAMFNGDDETPSVYLENYLREKWKVSVSILNTGHIGYSPEQYYYTLKEYGDRFRPKFVVVSVCPNDFGEGMAVLQGEGDWFDEAEYWLGQIQHWCRSQRVPYLFVPIPTHIQIETRRKDQFYPGQVCNIMYVNSGRYIDPLNEFVDEHIRLIKEHDRNAPVGGRSPLFNRQIDDDHFSPRGAELWAEIVGRRITLLFDPQSLGSDESRRGATASVTDPISATPELRR